jgi:putative transposase
VVVNIRYQPSIRYSPARVVQIMKSVSAGEVLRKFPELRKQLWAGEFWNDG